MCASSPTVKNVERAVVVVVVVAVLVVVVASPTVQ